MFNLLGPRIRGMYAWDLFAGTGVLGFESISRVRRGATLIERHIPTYKLVRENSEALDIKLLVTLVQADAFFWMRTASLPEPFSQQDPVPPWLIFCSPPYALYQEMPEKFERLMVDLQVVRHRPAACWLSKPRSPTTSLNSCPAIGRFENTRPPSWES